MDIDVTAAGIAWFCVSIPLLLTVFFRFNRIWSLRNLDILLLLCVAIGVALNRQAEWVNDSAVIALLVIGTSLLLVRLLCDNALEKRPRIEANLATPALGFLGVSLLVVLTVSIVFMELPAPAQTTVEEAKRTLDGQVNDGNENARLPTSNLLGALSHQMAGARIAAGILAGLGHAAVLAALMFIGFRHFQNGVTALAMGVLYLLLPSTVLDPNSVNQVLAAAWILWALALHRVPWAAGIFMGLACGSLLYPAMLLPIWFAFYGRKHSLRFAGSMLGVWAVLFGGLAVLSPAKLAFVRDSLQIIAGGATSLVLGEFPTTGSITDEYFRAPIVGSFVVMLIALTVWPREKRFEHLLAASAAVIVGTQFWYPEQFENYLSGYIPLVIVVALRPRLSRPTNGHSNGRRVDAPHREDVTQLEPVLSGTGTSLLR